ncbi:acetoacetate--CoA ligase [Legionella hackeliae]|uniref:Acetoacetyl-coenzyme A synthetase [putative SET domain] n=1 Tax=Legionella hackeliae TaxID=449 RepID=A0A0A8UM77_LEGHA|nr:acetoacetate--CoA ligase [Legionella hackeliae]KTD10359.1 acetoacetyl CoA synthetase [Legionella hackeliae]CEK09858.1 Acetoacetyl-coenzyme A synthetase [putative SET domain] [Legionella hackeliae]STX49768.1 acetoacetyl CoA synthetase [Legionella hackeliae]
MDTLVWQPNEPKLTRMWEFMNFAGEKYQQTFTQYQQLYDWSIKEPAQFWETICEYFKVTFDTPATEVLNNYDLMINANWFSGATFNFAEKLLSRHDDHPAIVSVLENGERHVLTYKQLHQEVAAVAAGLKEAGIVAGDRVAAIMPNVSFTIIAMLATTSLGAIWSSCSPDFGAQAAIDRLGQIEPKVLFACDGHFYMGKQHDAAAKVIEVAKAIPTLKKVVICPITKSKQNLTTIPHATTWQQFARPGTRCEFKSVPFAHPIYILFSSGTTGKPKCIVHGAGGTLLQHLKELGLHTDIRPHDNLFYYTTCGWMMWNWMVTTLALGATLTVYDGAPTHPDANRLFKLIDDEKITVFGTSAKFISSVEKAGASPRHQFSLKSLRAILSTGSPLLPKNYDFVYEQIKPDLQLSSISGGTDIVSCFALGNPILPVYRGELQCLGLGMAVNVFNEQGEPIREERGELVCTKPFPSMPVYFWNDADKKKYKHAYFERFDNIWAHGDYAEITRHNGLIIYGRSDAVLNPGGVRIGTAEIYRQVEKIPEVLDSVVIGQDWQDDVRVILFVKLREGIALDETIEDNIRKVIRHNASPRHVPAKILQVADIPRTISGKVVEIAVRQIVHGETINNIQSLANPEALDFFKNRHELND